MPTLVSRSSSAASDAAASAPPTAPSLRSLVAHAAAVERVRSRFLTAASRSDDALGLDDDDATSSTSSLSPHEALEAEFAAAVVFVDTYQGPHRILRQDHSAPKQDFYALYQQATVGPCPPGAPPPTTSKLELARWEKWRALGATPRHEAMRRYTTALDNLVDDWRRSAGLAGPRNLSASIISTTSSAAAGSPRPAAHQRPKKPANVFERLPRIYDEFGELQERVEEETRKREELEAQLAAFTQDNRALFTREIRQVDHMRASLTQLVQSLEEDVAQHYNELQLAQQRQAQLQAVVDGSLVLGIELRARQVAGVVTAWLRNSTLRRVVLVLVVFRVWNFLRNRRLPQALAQLLIRWLTALSSLDSSPRAAGTIVRR